MMDHKICFDEKFWLTIPKLSLLPLLIWSTDNALNLEEVERAFGSELSVHPFITLFDAYHIKTAGVYVYPKPLPPLKHEQSKQFM